VGATDGNPCLTIGDRTLTPLASSAATASSASASVNRASAQSRACQRGAARCTGWLKVAG